MRPKIIEEKSPNHKVLGRDNQQLNKEEKVISIRSNSNSNECERQKYEY